MIDPIWKGETMGFVMFNGQRLDVRDTNHYVRVYNNGERVTLFLAPSEIVPQLAYDQVNRPGCAIYMNGICVQVGYLDTDRLIAIGREIASHQIG